MKKENNNKLITLLVLLFIAVLLLGGYIVYDKVLDANTKNNNDEVPNQTAFAKYENFSKNMKKSLQKEENLPFQTITSLIVPTGYKISLKSNGDLSIFYYNEELNKKLGNEQLVSKVLSFFVYIEGQDASRVLYFIKNDGSVGSAAIEQIEKDKIEIENNIGNFQNIVSIVSATPGDASWSVGAFGPIFVDIDGNLYRQHYE